jgi:hypothetical protein
MNSQLKEDAHILCERIRELTKQIDNQIEKDSTSSQTNFLSQNPVNMKNIKLNITEKKCFDRPPAGKKVNKWDNTIIHWKSSLRRPW